MPKTNETENFKSGLKKAAEEMTEYLKMSVPALIGAVFIIVGIFWLGDFIFERSCENSAHVMGLEYKYDTYAGCMVKIKDEWSPIKSIRTEK